MVTKDIQMALDHSMSLVEMLVVYPYIFFVVILLVVVCNPSYRSFVNLFFFLTIN